GSPRPRQDNGRGIMAGTTGTTYGRHADDVPLTRWPPVRCCRDRRRRGRRARRVRARKPKHALQGRAMIATLALVVATITGTVRDSSGGVVPGASVIARMASGDEQQTTRGPAGRFTITPPAAGEIVVTVRAGVFAESQRRLSGDEGTANLEIVLAPATLLEAVTVTSSRGASRAEAP